MLTVDSLCILIVVLVLMIIIHRHNCNCTCNRMVADTAHTHLNGCGGNNQDNMLFVLQQQAAPLNF